MLQGLAARSAGGWHTWQRPCAAAWLLCCVHTGGHCRPLQRQHCTCLLDCQITAPLTCYSATLAALLRLLCSKSTCSRASAGGVSRADCVLSAS